eukprot:TRINITY_DN96677_c0_g1_i2.p1 TRINITY_DN96677_c0_g1~~TRINITY_DN96677_c0_g1_i2.p1  ORF type:complete len:481 (+),score=77.83 TRINITY_DN96677_c0_g1_i2:53-1495(+)
MKPAPALPMKAIALNTPSRYTSSPGVSPGAGAVGISPFSRPTTPGEIRKISSRPGSVGSSRGGASLQLLGPEPPRSTSSASRSPLSPATAASPNGEEQEEVFEELLEEEPLSSLEELPQKVVSSSDSEMVIKQLDFGGGTDSDDEAPGPLLPASSFACQRGNHGIRSLAMSDSLLSQALSQSAHLAETLSSPAAVGGTGKKWVRGDNIGRGSLGNVFSALDQISGQMFAVKEVLINKSDVSDMQFKDALENEIRICSALKHPSIVTFLGHDCIDSCLYIYMEYMIGGSMAGVLKQFGPFEESLIGTYTRDLIEGLAYLHTQEEPVLHRDIKSANVLMGQDPTGSELCAKLSDFGCSKRNQETLSHTLKGSILWMAPEVVKSVGYGRTADIWSFGCVLIEMGSAQPPWGKIDNPMQAMYKIGMSEETPALPEQLSDLCLDFARCCLQRDPRARLSSVELLEHPFVRDLKGPGDRWLSALPA